MSDLQGETREIEQPAYQNKRSFDQTAFWTATTIAGTTIWLTWRLWQDDGFKLRMLHLAFDVLQTVAAIIGASAIQVERYYHDYVATLH